MLQPRVQRLCFGRRKVFFKLLLSILLNILIIKTDFFLFFFVCVQIILRKISFLSKAKLIQDYWVMAFVFNCEITVERRAEKATIKCCERRAEAHINLSSNHCNMVNYLIGRMNLSGIIHILSHHIVLHFGPTGCIFI